MLNDKALTKARVLRKRMTESEKVLWRELRAKKLGFKFRRQEAFVFEDYHFIVDFCCPDKKLIIEIDGEIHNDSEMREYDKFRTESFQIASYKVMRFKNKEILNNLEEVLIKIKKVLFKRSFSCLSRAKAWELGERCPKDRERLILCLTICYCQKN